MTTSNGTTRELHDVDLDAAVAAIEVAHRAPEGEDGAWTLKTPAEFLTTIAQESTPPVPAGSYHQNYRYHAVTLREDGWLAFMVKHGEHVDNLLLAPADTHALYKFFSLIAMYRLGVMKAERDQLEACDREAYIATAVADPEVYARLVPKVIADIDAYIKREQVSE